MRIIKAKKLSLTSSARAPSWTNARPGVPSSSIPTVPRKVFPKSSPRRRTSAARNARTSSRASCTRLAHCSTTPRARAAKPAHYTAPLPASLHENKKSNYRTYRSNGMSLPVISNSTHRARGWSLYNLPLPLPNPTIRPARLSRTAPSLDVLPNATPAFNSSYFPNVVLLLPPCLSSFTRSPGLSLFPLAESFLGIPPKLHIDT